jgi:hypothetical protein
MMFSHGIKFCSKMTCRHSFLVFTSVAQTIFVACVTTACYIPNSNVSSASFLLKTHNWHPRSLIVCISIRCPYRHGSEYKHLQPCSVFVARPSTSTQHHDSDSSDHVFSSPHEAIPYFLYTYPYLLDYSTVCNVAPSSSRVARGESSHE